MVSSSDSKDFDSNISLLRGVLQLDDDLLVQAIREHRQATRTALMLIWKSCGGRSTRNMNKDDFALAIVHDMRREVESVRCMAFEEITATYDCAFVALWKLRTRTKTYNNAYHKEYQREYRRMQKETTLNEDLAWKQKVENEWPQRVSESVSIQCCKDYREGTNISADISVCAVCTRGGIGMEISTVVSPTAEPSSHTVISFDCLKVGIVTPQLEAYIQDTGCFTHSDDPALANTMLYSGSVTPISSGGSAIKVCKDCLGTLKQGKVPKFSLKNDLFLGELPEDLRDITWVEEKACAIYSSTINVTRIFQRRYGDDDTAPFALHGNSCAFEANTISTATVLPRAPADLNDRLLVIFVGPGPVRPSDLRSVFSIRKTKVIALLKWLKRYNPLYASIEISESNLSKYAEDDIPPGLLERVVHDNRNNVSKVFHEESAGFDEHPADAFVDVDNIPVGSDGSDAPADILVERMGTYDPECTRIPGRTYVASALRNLVRDPCGPDEPYGGDNESPDSDSPSGDQCTGSTLYIAHGSAPVNEYHNPTLFPGLFPTLFPLGCGGFETGNRRPVISFKSQASYLLDTYDRRFRYHQFYIFVALNIIQRREAHLATYFTVRKSNFEAIATELSTISPDMIRSVATHIEKEHNVSGLSAEERKVLTLLNKVKSISARVPGSQASKILARNIAFAYMGFFGIPDFFITLNPDALHSPIFQIFFGDKSVRLSDRHPTMPSKLERARRLAKDPIAAADFFDFCIRAFFQFLLGWDFEKGCSSRLGGILGHLRAWFGSTETTDRGRLHGHFLIWVLGGLNPDELHKRMNDPTFADRFFDFLENAIQHHLPTVEQPVPKNDAPEIERPPVPGGEDWNSERDFEAKRCGERFQRHSHKPVCHKYNNEDRCRFLFPHQKVLKSYYDPETHSIYVLCLDEMLNYCNWYVLVMCRHNHDIKYIHSGKASKAAVFYITDYITKGDLNTHELLTLLSKAVARLPESDGGGDSLSSREQAKKMLHKCVSQLQREQQIPAQLAARYIRGRPDAMTSHSTVPLLVSALLARIRSEASKAGTSALVSHQPGQKLPQHEPNLDPAQSDEYEPIRLSLDDGAMGSCTQVDDYWFRDPDLGDMGFYDFARFVRKVTRNESAASSDRLGKAHRYRLLPPHSQSETHELVRHVDYANLVFRKSTKELVPRIVGCTIPRQHHSIYALFVLALFYPIGLNLPLIDPSIASETLEHVTLADEHRQILRNWEALHECEDERDADRMRKANSASKADRILAQQLDALSADEGFTIDVSDMSSSKRALRDEATAETLRILRDSGFFAPQPPTSSDGAMVSVFDASCVNEQMLKGWDKSVKEQETLHRHNRLRALNPTASVSDVAVTRIVDDAPILSNIYESDPDVSAPATSIASTGQPLENQVSLVERISDELSLNREQRIAFEIASKRFFQVYASESPTGVSDSMDIEKPMHIAPVPLRMFLTGPGGTGKTHVVKALHSVMSAYGAAHRIRYLAPTGSAAALIDGTTVHDGLGISVRKSNGKGNRQLGESEQDYTMVLTVEKRNMLRSEWRDVWFMLLDEVSLAGEQLICEIDCALKYAKESKNEWFGGINIIVAGDLFQFGPVSNSPVYAPIRDTTRQDASEIMRRIGRMAYKSIDTVVELVEQKRMSEDSEYADAVLRLRKRKCEPCDVDLFNSRVVKSSKCLQGIDMSIDQRCNAVAIVPTNMLRENINVSKAIACTETDGSPQLVLSSADDIVMGSKNRPPNPLRTDLLKLNVNALPSAARSGSKPLSGILPLYKGMPVILKAGNISTELKLTNGVQGYVREIKQVRSNDGYTTVPWALAEFPDCDVALPGLPPKWYPIRPSTWRFTVADPERPGSTIKICRKQLPIQPAFSVTGHSAQGKTLPQVLVDMSGGGFQAYVAASRPRSRKGLFLTRAITLEDLNEPSLPIDLVNEDKRLKALTHNTYVRYGYLNEPLVDVPDPESETRTVHLPSIEFPPDPASKSTSQGKKRKKETGISERDTKRLKFSSEAAGSTQNTASGHPPGTGLSTTIPQKAIGSASGALGPAAHPAIPFFGCRWDSVNWSCAYDAFVTAWCAVFSCASDNWQAGFSSASPLCQLVAESIRYLLRADSSVSRFNTVRDTLRDSLTHIQPVHFPRFGAVVASVERIFEELRLGGQPMLTMSNRFQCLACTAWFDLEDDFPVLIHPALWGARSPYASLSPTARSASLQTWLQLMLTVPTARKSCPACGVSSADWTRGPHPRWMNTPPAWLALECESVMPVAEPLPTPSIDIPTETPGGTVRYHLRAIVYLGSGHFTSRVLLPHQATGGLIIWRHDGIRNGGIPEFDKLILPGQPFPQREMMTMDVERKPVVFLMARDIP